MKRGTWAVVLIKDFGAAKQRLSDALPPAQRAALARRLARRAIDAAAAADHVLVVAGGGGAARLATACGAQVLREAHPDGQNAAAARGIARALDQGAEAVLLLSSDLPRVERGSIRALLERGAALPAPCAVAAAATGRGGTNALLLRPPDCLSLHFGEASLEHFATAAASSGTRFVVHEDPDLALDLDVPADLLTWRALEAAV